MIPDSFLRRYKEALEANISSGKSFLDRLPKLPPRRFHYFQDDEMLMGEAVGGDLALLRHHYDEKRWEEDDDWD